MFLLANNLLYPIYTIVGAYVLWVLIYHVIRIRKLKREFHQQQAWKSKKAELLTAPKLITPQQLGDYYDEHEHVVQTIEKDVLELINAVVDETIENGDVERALQFFGTEARVPEHLVEMGFKLYLQKGPHLPQEAWPIADGLPLYPRLYEHYYDTPSPVSSFEV